MNDQTYFSVLFLIGIQENDYIFPTWTGLCFSSPSFEYEFIVIHFGFGHGVPYNSLSVFFFSCCSGSCSSPEGSVMASLVLLSKTVTTVSSGPAASWHHITHPLSQCILLTVRAVRPCTNGLWGTIPPFQ